jgi:hypothetical protein
MVRFRALPKEIAGWRRLSRANAMTLSTWIRDSLNARFDEKKKTAGRRTSSS